MRLLLVASEAREFSGVLPRCSGIRAFSTPLRFAREARLGGNELLLAADGVGVARAAAAVDVCLNAWRPEIVISFGYCGAVDSGLKIADVVVATEVHGGDGLYPAAPVRSNAAFRSGPILTIGRVAQSSAEKREWRATGAIAVEMEAAGVARRAEAFGLPVQCIRSVTDLAEEDLANDFNLALRSDGRFDTITLMRCAMRRPLTRFPELIRLRKRCVRASETLGEFIANCRY